MSESKSKFGSAGNSITGDDKTCTLIRSEEIRSALLRSKMKKVLLAIYPVKLSNNADKRDFDLRIAYQDVANHGESINSKIDPKVLETQFDWYVGFLKKNRVPREMISYGYFINIDTNLLKNSIGINICYIPGQNNAYYYVLGQKTEESGDGSSSPGDSTCKCPPECCQYAILTSDSTGKCPPECTEVLYYQPAMKGIIERKYK